MAKKTEEVVTESTQQAIQFIKSWIFNIIAVVIVIAMLALSLGVMGLRNISWHELLNIAVETVPFFLTSVLLSTNFYTKGTFAGKMSEKFKLITERYSDIVNNLDGKKITSLSDFCVFYNQEALRRLQTSVLKKKGVTYEDYAIERVTDDNKKLLPLKMLSKKELIEIYGKDHMDIVKTILYCNRIKIKGVNVNILLGNLNSEDITNLGKSEGEIRAGRTAFSAVSYIVSTFALTLLAINNIATWGWAGIVLVVFKLAWIVCSTYMQYFRGYGDITIHVCNHIARKTDILKEFDSWYNSSINS